MIPTAQGATPAPGQVLQQGTVPQGAGVTFVPPGTPGGQYIVSTPTTTTPIAGQGQVFLQATQDGRTTHPVMFSTPLSPAAGKHHCQPRYTPSRNLCYFWTCAISDCAVQFLRICENAQISPTADCANSLERSVKCYLYSVIIQLSILLLTAISITRYSFIITRCIFML